MNLINNIRKSFWDFFLKRDLRNTKRTKIVSSFDSATKIGIVYFFKDKDAFKVVDQFRHSLKEAGKNVKLLVYIENEELTQYLPQVLTIDYITDKHLNFYFKPIDNKAKDFISEQFDVLIDLNFEGRQELKYVTALSSASFKVGAFNTDSMNPLDMMIKLDKDNNLERLITEIETYLRMIKSKNA